MQAIRTLLILLVLWDLALAQEGVEKPALLEVGFISSTSVGRFGFSVETYFSPVTEGSLSLFSGSGSVAGRLKYSFVEEENYAVFAYGELGYPVGGIPSYLPQECLVYGGDLGISLLAQALSLFRIEPRELPLYQRLEVGLTSTPLFRSGLSIAITSSLHFRF